MHTLELHYVALATAVIDLLTAVVIAIHVGKALVLILRGRSGSIDLARLAVAQGVLAALGFSVAGSLLKTIALENWATIRNFAFIIVFRTLLKRVFQHEQEAVMNRSKPAVSEGEVLSIR